MAFQNLSHHFIKCGVRQFLYVTPWMATSERANMIKFPPVVDYSDSVVHDLLHDIEIFFVGSPRYFCKHSDLRYHKAFNQKQYCFDIQVWANSPDII